MFQLWFFHRIRLWIRKRFTFALHANAFYSSSWIKIFSLLEQYLQKKGGRKTLRSIERIDAKCYKLHTVFVYAVVVVLPSLRSYARIFCAHNWTLSNLMNKHNLFMQSTSFIPWASQMRFASFYSIEKERWRERERATNKPVYIFHVHVFLLMKSYFVKMLQKCINHTQQKNPNEIWSAHQKKKYRRTTKNEERENDNLMIEFHMKCTHLKFWNTISALKWFKFQYVCVCVSGHSTFVFVCLLFSLLSL